jgi:hypothetical protein
VEVKKDSLHLLNKVCGSVLSCIPPACVAPKIPLATRGRIEADTASTTETRVIRHMTKEKTAVVVNNDDILEYLLYT